MLVPALNLKGDLVVFIFPYIVHSSIFEAKALCDWYSASVQQDISWLDGDVSPHSCVFSRLKKWYLLFSTVRN